MKKPMILLALAAASVASAAQADVRIDARQANQQRQIDAGKRSGKLSVAERNRLTAQQHAIKRTEAQYARSGGRLTDAEERSLNGMLDRSQNAIERAKHNRVRGRNGIHL